MRSMPLFRFGASLFVALTCALVCSAGVLFNEIHYHPVERAAFDSEFNPVIDLSEDVHEFIELHNPDSVPQALTGWSVTGGVEFLFPDGTVLPPGGYLVVAKNPERLAAVPAYGLRATDILGPWTGKLGNSGDTLRLKNPAGAVVDTVSYKSSAPWPASANSLGADPEWTGIDFAPYQYRGRSLERVRPDTSSADPGNWIASPLAAGPSPGRENSPGAAGQPLTVVLLASVSQAADGHRLIRASQPVEIECLLSRLPAGARPLVEYFADDINLTNETVESASMTPIGLPGENRFTVELPGRGARTVVRWRVALATGSTTNVISPRSDDPFRWHAYFVSPVRAATTNSIYDIFISSRSLNILQTNIASTPRRWTSPDPPARLRESWNATQPAVLVVDGHVYDIRMRHHGSQFRREVGRRSYKLQFPAYDRLDNRESLFVTDKDYRTYTGHAIFRAADLPTSRTWWLDLYLNNNARLQRLAQEEYDSDLLDRYHEEHNAAAPPGTPPETPGEFYKTQGTFEREGPFFRGDGSRLPNLSRNGTNYWTARQRYEIIYSLQNRSWFGQSAFMGMHDAMWLARSNLTTAPRGESTNRLAAFFADNWDLQKAFTHVTLVNWGGVWDDTIHNFFLWRQSNGRWSLLPWDFDDMFDARPAGDSIFDGAPFNGANYFKQSLMAAYREQYKRRAWELNNTLLDPDNLAALGIPTQVTRWAGTRQANVNRQLALGNYTRPQRPRPQFPTNGMAIGPGGGLRTSPYANTNTVPAAHAATIWQIRRTTDTWFEPLITLTNPVASTSLPIPADLLQLGRAYVWRAQHVDADGHVSAWSTNAVFTYGPASNPAWRLSEVLAENGGSVRNGSDEPDFVELATDDPSADLTGWSLTDDLSNPRKFVFATNPAHTGRVVVWCDRRNNSPGLHSGFGLDNDGEVLALFRPTPDGPELADVVVFGVQLADRSIGRIDGAWRLCLPTPLAANSPATVGNPGSVRINEWLARSPDGSPDWIELYNPDSQPVDLSGLSLTDDFQIPAKSPFRPLTFVGAGAYLRIVADGSPAQGGNHVGFKLSEDGSAIALFDGSGRRMDHVLFGSQAAATAYGRLPDGTGAVIALGAGTPGAANTAPDLNRNQIPDFWESAQGLDKLGDQGLPQADADGDGLSNRLEYLLGTDPRDAQSDFRLSLEVAGNDPVIRFWSAPRQRYALQRFSPDENVWTDYRTLTPSQAGRFRAEQIPAEDASPGRLFRVVTRP
jgi:hypothetical protein